MAQGRPTADPESETFDDLMVAVEPDLRAVARRLRDIIYRVHPGAVEVVRLGDRTATFGLGLKRMSQGYAYIGPTRKWINLGFYKGAELPDPKGLLEGSGAMMRHVKVAALISADDPALRQLVVDAVTERREALGM